MKLRRAWVVGGGIWVALLFVPLASAVEVRLTIENLSPAGSTALSPFTVAAHNGTFDAFDAGAAAGMGTEDVAELGNGTQLISELMAIQPTAVSATVVATSGGFGPGIFLPGGTGSVIVSLDPTMHRYLTYGSMVVPSNDAFLGNDSPTAVELFDAAGNFVASELLLTGAQIWDSGTEVNQLTGAAYVVGQDALAGDDENGAVGLVNLGTQFMPYLNSEVPSGGMFTTAPAANDPIAAISFQVVPEPSAIILMLVGWLATWGLLRKGESARHGQQP